jgi:TonB-linked SusC/RagA family outer membrane protein
MKKKYYFLVNRQIQVITCLFFVFLLSIQSNSIFAQTQLQTIEGVVSSVEGFELPGASVLEKGTNNGVVSDFDGKYSIKVKKGATLLISYVGYGTKEVVINNQATINVVLKSDNTLDEIIVVGYGTQRKSDLTGAVSSIKAKELTKIPLVRADQLLQGKAAGVSISSTDGAPGGNVKIRIRGANSINGDNSPLVVIDGFLGGTLANLNPSDIKSIEVLKDASATAVYGSRGANGVILVTTKTGKKGKVSVDYSTFMTTSTLRNKLDLLNAGDYAETYNARAVGLGGTALYTQSEISNLKANGGVDWQDQIFKNAILQNHNLSISGGNDNTTYLFSLNHVDEEGILLNSNYKRYQFRTNLNTKINDKLRVGVRLYGIREESNPQSFNSDRGTPVTDALSFPAAVTSVYDDKGDYVQSSNDPRLWNPVASALSLTRDRALNTFNINGFVDYKLSDELTLNLAAGASYLSENIYSFFSKDNRNAFANNGKASVLNRESVGWINTNNLTYQKDIGENDKLVATVVYEQQQIGPEKVNGFNTENFITQSLGYYGVGLANTVSGQNIRPLKQRSIQSFLGRLNYSMQDKWLFTLSGRYDGSSVLSEGNKWSFFPSAAIAWKIKNETFLKDVEAVSDLKLRASYGKVGSQGVAVNSSRTSLSVGQNYSLDGSSAAVGVGLGSAGAKNLKWEITSQYDLGLDVGFLDGKIRAGADYYYKRTNDLLLRVSVPSIAGLPSGKVLRNLGELENSGFELSLDVDAIKKENFSWNLNLNLATNKSKVLDLGDEDQILGGQYGGSSQPALFIIEKGQPLGNIRGLDYLGVWKSSEASQAAVFHNVPGDSKYRDVNGDNIISDLDRTTIGNGTPSLNWGLSSNFTYKNFDLNLFFNGAHGYDIYNYTRSVIVDVNNAPELLNRWTPSNENTNVPAFSTTDILRSNTSRYLENGSFIRLKSVNLGYNFKENVLEKLHVSSLRLYAASQNLITITDYTGYDPEINSAGSSDINSGLDLGGYPPAKTFTLGLNITF